MWLHTYQTLADAIEIPLTKIKLKIHCNLYFRLVVLLTSSTNTFLYRFDSNTVRRILSNPYVFSTKDKTPNLNTRSFFCAYNKNTNTNVLFPIKDHRPVQANTFILEGNETPGTSVYLLYMAHMQPYSIDINSMSYIASYLLNFIWLSVADKHYTPIIIEIYRYI